MGKSKKSLIDRGDGDFILNESGTSVKTDDVEGLPDDRSDVAYEKNDDEPYIPDTADEQKDTTD
jgi:hypothetical protein